MNPTHLDLENRAGSNGSQMVVRLSGNLSLETVHDFIQKLRPERAPHLVLDMSGVGFLDSAGVGALVQIFVHRRSLEQTFTLAGLTKQGHAVIQVAGLSKLLPMESSVEAALSKSA